MICKHKSTKLNSSNNSIKHQPFVYTQVKRPNSSISENSMKQVIFLTLA